MLCCLTPAHSIRASQTDLQIKFHGIDPSTLLHTLQKENRWPTFTPPEAGQSRRYRGLILHRRSHLLPQMGGSTAEIDGVPMHDSADDQVEAGGPERLTVKGAIPDFAALVEEHGALELMSGFTLVETGLAAPAQWRARIPLDHEQRTFNAAEFAERFGQVAGFRRGRQPFEDRRGRDGARRNQRCQVQEIVPVLHNQSGVDGRSDMVRQRRIGVGLLEGMEFPVLDVAKAGRKALADQGEQRKDMIAGATGIGKQLLNLQDCVVIEQAVENIDSFALGWADRQNAEVAVLIGKPAVEFCPRLTAIVQIDIAKLGGTVAALRNRSHLLVHEGEMFVLPQSLVDLSSLERLSQ